MNLTPPPGSKISLGTEGTLPVIVIPQREPGGQRYFGGLFLLFWLGGWALGMHHAISTLLLKQFDLFLLFWLGAWTVGGCFAASMIYRMFRQSVPETLKLGLRDVIYDPGIPTFEMSSGEGSTSTTTFSDAWKSMFQKRSVLTLDRRRLETLRLRETESGNRLTVDVDSARVEIARAVSEVDREWLYRTLTGRYVPASAQPAGD